MPQDEYRNPQQAVTPSGEGLSEAQIAAIESAFADHDRVLARLRRELDEVRDQPEERFAADELARLDERLQAIESRLDQQDQALRHLLHRLIDFFEREGPA